nr:unnamed protein product [Spirometra erinaceieuropaei]
MATADDCKSLFDYLKTIDANELDALYGHPPTCLIVFRELSELAKHLVLRLLFLEQTIPKAIVAGSDSGEVGICIRKVLLLSGLMKRGGSDSTIGITQRGFQFLLMDKPSQVLRFILHYFNYLRLSFLSIGKSYPTEVLSDAQQNLLQHMRELGLAYQRKRTAPRFYVTRLALSLSFGSLSGGRTSKGIGNISGGLSVAPGVATATDSDPMSLLPTGVSAPGLRSVRSLSLSTTLAHPAPAAVAEVGYILVETNFRLYAYTDSPLRTALLSLFSKIRVRYPNLVVADITRDSVREALLRGISANQIISFLTTNAHPDMLRQPSILPPTLIDQVRLWELERERLFAQEGCLYEQFAKNKDFEMVRDFAKSQGFLLWECPDRRLMVVSKTGHEDVRKFWRQNRP